MNEQSRLQLERYLQLVNRRKWVLLIPVLLAVAGAALVSFMSTPVYTATATIRIDPGQEGQNPDAAQRVINTYAEIIRGEVVLNKVITDLNLHTSAADLEGRVSASAVGGTELVRITTKASKAEESAAIANDLLKVLQDPQILAQLNADPAAALAQRVNDVRTQLDDQIGELQRLKQSGAPQAQVDAQQAQVNATQDLYQSLLQQQEQAAASAHQQSFAVIQSADTPGAPISPRWSFNLLAGLLAGAAAGVSLALVLEYIDPTLRGVRDLESVTPLPVLASIPFGIRWKYPPPPVSPEYRLLATKIQTALNEHQHKSVLFMSTRDEEGNTTVATYTAMAMAQAGLRVLLLDANLNRPDLHKLFNLPLSPGLYNFISTNGARPTKPMEQAALDIIQSSPVPRLYVLTAGTKMSDPSELLASQEMRAFLDYLESQWDVIVIDGASMLSSAGSAVIAPVVDSVVLVAAEGQASSHSVEESIDELTSLGAKPAGLVYCKATET
ncbi:MAG TPA: Wzz/FepE/Etk N-terminal domain-containing protein [Dehalococcoidia bacterium]|nr:Wzz/FepE/Etk N-terminal domain-containing protein [Dehalococcoidia bacterium]